MKSYVVHYQNKYPGGRVIASDSALDAYCAAGEHRVALRKNGAGQWQDCSEELGCMDRHDLAPIPKDARAKKLFADGKIGLSEEYADRVQVAKELSVEGKIPSIAEMKKSGFKFDDAGVITDVPKASKA